MMPSIHPSTHPLTGNDAVHLLQGGSQHIAGLQNGPRAGHPQASALKVRAASPALPAGLARPSLTVRCAAPGPDAGVGRQERLLLAGVAGGGAAQTAVGVQGLAEGSVLEVLAVQAERLATLPLLDSSLYHAPRLLPRLRPACQRSEVMGGSTG